MFNIRDKEGVAWHIDWVTYPHHHTDEGYQQWVLQKRFGSRLISSSCHNRWGYLLRVSFGLCRGATGYPGEWGPVAGQSCKPRNNKNSQLPPLPSIRNSFNP